MKSPQLLPAGDSTCPQLARKASLPARAPPAIDTAGEAAETWRCVAFNSIGPRSIAPYCTLSIVLASSPFLKPQPLAGYSRNMVLSVILPAMKNATRYAALALVCLLVQSCSVPPVMIPANATCEDLNFLYYQQREEWKEAAVGLGVYSGSARNELERIEAAMIAKGCLAPADTTVGGYAAESETPNDTIEAISAILFTAAPDEFVTYAAAGEALAAAAPSESTAYYEAGVALYVRAPDEFTAYYTAGKNLQDAAPEEIEAIGTGERVLYATIVPEEYARATISGKALLNAAPEAFAAYNTAWKNLREAAPGEFAVMDISQKALYAAAPVRFGEAEAAALALYAAAPAESIALEYANLQTGVLDALQGAAPREFAAYMAAPSGTQAENESLQALAATAPNEFAAAAAVSATLASAIEAIK